MYVHKDAFLSSGSAWLCPCGRVAISTKLRPGQHRPNWKAYDGFGQRVRDGNFGGIDFPKAAPQGPNTIINYSAYLSSFIFQALHGHAGRIA